MEVGHYVTIARKPRADEPGASLWASSRDPYLGTIGIITKISQFSEIHQGQIVLIKYAVVKHWDLNLSAYPTYCLTHFQGAITSQGSCSCKTETLMARGCRCGAFTREKGKK